MAVSVAIVLATVWDVTYIVPRLIQGAVVGLGKAVVDMPLHIAKHTWGQTAGALGGSDLGAWIATTWTSVLVGFGAHGSSSSSTKSNRESGSVYSSWKWTTGKGWHDEASPPPTVLVECRLDPLDEHDMPGWAEPKSAPGSCPTGVLQYDGGIDIAVISGLKHMQQIRKLAKKHSSSPAEQPYQAEGRGDGDDDGDWGKKDGKKDTSLEVIVVPAFTYTYNSTDMPGL